MGGPSARVRNDDDEVDNADDEWAVVSSSPVDPSSRSCAVASDVDSASSDTEYNQRASSS